MNKTRTTIPPEPSSKIRVNDNLHFLTDGEAQDLVVSAHAVIASNDGQQRSCCLCREKPLSVILEHANRLRYAKIGKGEIAPEFIKISVGDEEVGHIDGNNVFIYHEAPSLKVALAWMIVSQSGVEEDLPLATKISLIEKLAMVKEASTLDHWLETLQDIPAPHDPDLGSRAAIVGLWSATARSAPKLKNELS